MSEILEAELTWIGGRFERGVRVEIGADGRILRAGKLAGEPATRLEGRALLPGFIDVHSHAFQRGLRGRGERFPRGQGDFWTWREAMYELVEQMDAERLRALSVQAFREMLAAGITSVGEFHYLHHDRSNAGFALDQAVLEAARETGIRLVMLQTYYATGGVERPLAGAQRRFRVRDPSEYWDQLDALASRLDWPAETLGAVVHSIRAASIEDLARIHAEAKRRGLVFHIHVEETAKELVECRAAYQKTPMRILLDELAVDERFTAVHCTQTSRAELEEFLARGGTVCACPTTEGGLGDGISELASVQGWEGRLAFGTDSNERLSMLEEMRWCEFAQRLRHQRRGLLRDRTGEVARPLLDAATKNGARSLGIDAGEIRSGAWADFVALDLGEPCLRGSDADTLPEALVFGAGDEVIAGVAVGGRWLGGGPT